MVQEGPDGRGRTFKCSKTLVMKVPSDPIPRPWNDVAQRADLLRGWMSLFKRFRKANRKCERSLSEERVHALRLSARQCLPVVEVMRALRPDDALWSMTYRGLRDVLAVLGPLRDAQVRHERLEEMTRNGSVKSLLARTKWEVRSARPPAEWALAMFRALPRKALKKELKGRKAIANDPLAQAIGATLEHRSARLRERWTAIDPRRPESLHRARVALKRYRYLLMALGPGLDATHQQLLPRLERMQQALGGWHDDRLFSEWLQHTGQQGRHVLAHATPPAGPRSAQLATLLRRQRMPRL